MTALETVARYYDAWQHRQGDFGDVSLAVDSNRCLNALRGRSRRPQELAVPGS